MRLLVLFALLSLFACLDPPPEVLTGRASVIPLPAEMKVREGSFVLAEGIELEVDEPAPPAVDLFFAEWQSVLGWRPRGAINDPRITVVRGEDLPPEGYTLDVTEEAVSITYADEAGAFYAFQTLRQLLPARIEGGTLLPSGMALALPLVSIRDAPRFGWRGFMLDVSRHFFTVDEVKRVIDLAAENKLNRFHWHLTDDQGWRIEIKSRPKLTEVGAWRADRTNTDEQVSDWWGRAPQGPEEAATYGGFYTQEEIRDIVDYARQRAIEIVPEIDMPGHAQAAVAAYPEIGAVNAETTVATGGVFRNNTLNPGKDATYQFAEDVLNEVMDLFPFDYVHVGGDECNKSQWKADPEAQAKMKSEGLETEEELQSYFIRRLETLVNARGKTLIGWDEILEGGLAPNAVVMSWRGTEGGIAAATAGHEVIMTPSKYCYLDLKQGHDDLEPNLGYSHAFLSDAYQYEVIPPDFSPEQAALIKGIQANLWTESISDWGKLTYMVYPRIWAIAENAWTAPERKDWPAFTRRVLRAYDRLDARGTRYAVSAFSPWIHHRRVDDGIEITLTTEVPDLDIRYTTSGIEPDTAATAYTTPFSLSPGETVTARAFLAGRPVGYPASLDLPVHKGRTAEADPPALADLQYASLTPVDENWHQFSDSAEVNLRFPEPTEVSGVGLSALRYTISGIYPPGRVTVLGRREGDTEYRTLGKLDQAEIAAVQGRNKVRSQVSFSPVAVTDLRVRLTAHASIPAGHHRVGEAARLYVDELVVE